MNEPLRRRRLPLKVLYRGLELSNESEALLEEAMEKMNSHDSDEVLQSALGLLLQSLEAAPLPETHEPTHRTGADLVAAMQAMPHRDEIEFEHSRPHVPVPALAPVEPGFGKRLVEALAPVRGLLTEEEADTLFRREPPADRS